MLAVSHVKPTVLLLSFLFAALAFPPAGPSQKRDLHPRVTEIATLLKDGKRDKVEQQVSILLKSHSSDFELLLALGQLLGTHKEIALAETCFRRATEISPNSFPAQFNLGLTLFQDGRPAQAVGPLTLAAALNRSSFEARYVWGRALLEIGDQVGGIRRLREGQALRPSHSGVLTLLGVEYLQGGYYDDAIQVLQQAIQLESSSEKLDLLLIQAYHGNFDFARATEQAQKTAHRFPGSPNAQFRLGYQLQMEGRFSESETAYHGVLKLDPGHLPANLALGQLRQRQMRYAEAATHYERVVSAHSKSHEARLGLAKACLGLKQYERAKAILMQLLQEVPQEPQIHLLLAQVYQAEGKLPESAAERQRFLKLTSQLATATGMSHSLPTSRGKKFPAE
jgi:tetratricopeptide (TPR) repeat protein